MHIFKFYEGLFRRDLDVSSSYAVRFFQATHRFKSTPSKMFFFGGKNLLMWVLWLKNIFQCLNFLLCTTLNGPYMKNSNLSLYYCNSNIDSVKVQACTRLSSLILRIYFLKCDTLLHTALFFIWHTYCWSNLIWNAIYQAARATRFYSATIDHMKMVKLIALLSKRSQTLLQE